MKHYKIALAFGLGCLAALSLHHISAVSAQQNKGAKSDPLASKLASLERRATDLEKKNVTQQSKTVVAPFEVRDPQGRTIFMVNTDGVKVSHSSNSWVKMSGDKDGGQIIATSSSGTYSGWLDTAFGVPSFSIVEDNSPRVQLGKGVEHQNYRVLFLSKSSQNIAAIGESSDSDPHTGLVLIFDKSGILRDRLAVTTTGKGLVDVLGANKLPLVQLREGGHNGGYLLICSANGCDPPMVEAGDAGGYGIVRAGPYMFQRGVTMLDLPGSVIMGKSQ